MRRSGWGLGIAIVVVMGAGAWLGLRPYLTRETVQIGVIQAPVKPAPSSDGLSSGVRFAVAEAQSRAGRFRVATAWADASTSSEYGRRHPAFGAANVVITVATYEAGRPPAGGDALISALETDPQAGGLRLLPSREKLGAAAAGWAKRVGASRPLLLRESFDQGIDGVLAGFRNEARRHGLPVPPGEPVLEPIDAIVEEVLRANSDFVFYGGERAPYSRMAQVFAALRRKGYEGRLAMADVDVRVSMLDAPGPLVEGTYLVSPLAPPPPDFPAKYRAIAGKDPGPHVYYGYLAGRAALDAIAAAHSKDPSAIRRAAGALPQFDENGETRTNAPALYLVKEGRFEFVEVLK